MRSAVTLHKRIKSETALGLQPAPPESGCAGTANARGRLKVEAITAHIHSDAEIETTITALGREPGDGLVVLSDVFTNAHRAPIISAAARNSVPAVYTVSEAARMARSP